MPGVSIKKDDMVAVSTGRDRGKQGRVLKVLTGTNRVLVQGVNKIKKHERPNPQKQVKGGIIEREAGIHISNLMVVCPDCTKPTRVGKRVEGGKKVRFCKKCNVVIDGKSAS